MRFPFRSVKQKTKCRKEMFALRATGTSGDKDFGGQDFSLFLYETMILDFSRLATIEYGGFNRTHLFICVYRN